MRHRLRWLPRPSAPRIALLAALVLAVAYVPLARAPFVQELEGQLLDLRFQLKPRAPVSDDVILVLIDDASLAQVGRWPWPRKVVADLLRRVDAAGAETMGIDLLFAEPETEVAGGASERALRDALQALQGDLAAPQAASLAEVLRRLLDEAPGDRALAAALRDAAAVIPFTFEFDDATRGAPPPAFVAATAYRVVVGTGADRGVLQASGLLAPIAAIGNAAGTLGHANVILDASGAARFEHPVIGHRGGLYPSFALEVARRHLGVSRGRVAIEVARGIRLGERFVPTDERMRVAVDYERPAHFETVSAAAVLRGDLAPGAFAGKVVLVGGAAAGIGGGFVTPFAPRQPGLARHATVIEDVLQGRFLVRRDAHALVHAGLVLVGGGLIGAAAAGAGLLGATAGFLLLLASVVAGNLLAFLRQGLWLDLLLPLVALALIYFAVIAYTYFVGLRQQRVLRRAFKHYLHPDLVDQVARNAGLLRRGGEERELTVLFVDLRDSAALANLLPPARFVELLNDFFEMATRAIFAERGMLDKFMGDGLLGVFGAPIAVADHAGRACRAALAMQDALPDLRRRWGGAALPPLDFGVGINTGRMIIGNMGTAARFDYTVIGDEANLGARLEAANKEFGTRLLVSESTYRRVDKVIAAREIDVVTFRGIARPVRTFELLGPEPLPEAERRRVGTYAAGLAAYRAGDWRTALERFDAVLATAPGDGPARVFAERCRERLGTAAAPATG